MPVSCGGSSCIWKRSGELMFALLEEKQKVHFEAEKLALAEETATFYRSGCERTERILKLQNTYMEYTWSGLMPRRQRKSKCWKRNIKMCWI
jgi:hypothetical protein